MMRNKFSVWRMVVSRVGLALAEGGARLRSVLGGGPPSYHAQIHISSFAIERYKSPSPQVWRLKGSDLCYDADRINRPGEHE